MKAKRFWGASASAAAYVLYAPSASWIPQAAHAQTTEQPMSSAPASPSTSSSTSPSTAVDDTTVEKFAAAYTAVAAIQTQAADELKTTSDPQKADEVKKNAESRALEAVQSNGLKPEEFNNIAKKMASDENLRTRVAAKINQRTGGG